MACRQEAVEQQKTAVSEERGEGTGTSADLAIATAALQHARVVAGSQLVLPR